MEADIHPARADGRAGPVLTRGVCLGLLAAGLFVTGCAVIGERPTPTVLRYVALGDSYTIGTSVEPPERFPDQLVAALGPDVPTLRLEANLGVNGYTSSDLIREELPALEALDPEFATVLIGVNDVVQGVPDTQYAGNVAAILDDLLARLPAERIVCVATPDYTRTPRGGDYGDPAEQSDGIVRFNAILGEACDQRGIAFVPDIFEISREAADDSSLVADDGLHPSGAQYARWVDVIEPVVRSLLERETAPATPG